MPIRDGKTVPYQNKKQVRQGVTYLENTFDPAIGLAYRITAASGLRISDVLNLNYNENINYETNTIRIIESKGYLAACARARIAAIEVMKDIMIKCAETKFEMAEYMTIRAAKFYPYISEKFKPMADKTIKEYVDAVKPKYHEVVVTKRLMNRIKARQKKFDGIDDGLIFSRKTLKSNRAKNMEGVISRVYVWRCFASIGEALKLGINTSCHQLRKSFAVFLYKETGNDMAMVIERVGWANDTILRRYLSITKDKIDLAVSRMLSKYV